MRPCFQCSGGILKSANANGLNEVYSFVVLTRINFPPPDQNLFQNHSRYHYKNVLTKCHEDWTIHVTFKVKNAPPPGGHVFQPTRTIFTLDKDIIATNLLTGLASS
ncbi:hypothetical protein DPMN_018461 [Dreissena polymorpha]|uniref:Uncharacterized protein n=1 Tax=Dreissena polymorpha TaxID=45954 RepID=A0A9D4NF61_DREPO|nr:hypothetical protein DPMN_018461 [Dreissena polymorpha]